MPFVHQCTPGLTLLSLAPDYPIRGLYTASNGFLFGVANLTLCYINSSWLWTPIGTLTPSTLDDMAGRDTPVSMVDNGNTLFIVDGSSTGWQCDVNNFSGFTAVVGEGSALPAAHVEDGFYGADRIDYSDTFLILNKPSTYIFYISGSVATTFDPLDFASKTAKPDPIVSIIVQHRVIWLLGTQSYEVWYDTGGGGAASLSNNTFPFEALPGAFGDHGCAAKYSPAKADNSVFWLSQDISGNGIVYQGIGYVAKRVSTHAIENTIGNYSTISDAIGYCYNQNGHYFYVLNFPIADATWVYDASNEQWHERVWLDENGGEHRHLCNFATNAYGTVVGSDWRNGNLYEYDLNNYTDNGSPILRLRSFPHQIDMSNNRRVIYNQVIANMQVGTDTQAQGSTTIINCNFNASDGTLLQNYSNTSNIGATFTKISSDNAIIVSKSMVAQVAGAVLYQASGTPSTPNYSVSFVMTPTKYSEVPTDGATSYVIARANVSHNGYLAEISSDGSDYFINLTVMGGATTTVELGTIASGFYQVTMTLESVSVQVAVYRSQDGRYVDIGGNWGGSPTQAISIVDSTYATAGKILIGGDWI